MDDDDRTAMVRGLKRGVASALVSLVVLFGLLYVTLGNRFPDMMYGPSQEISGAERLLWGPSSVIDPSSTSWELLWPTAVGRTLATVVVAVVVALVIGATVTYLLPRRPLFGGVVGSAVAFPIGALSIPVLAFAASQFLVRAGVGPASNLGDGVTYVVLLSGVLVGVVLAGFGVRALLRNGSVTSLRRDPTVILVDGWLVALWIGGAIFVVEWTYNVAGVGYWIFRALKLSDAVLLFGVLATLQVPLLLLVVLREVGWSVSRARDGALADGGVVGTSRSVGGVSPARADGKRLLERVLARRDVTVGIATAALLAVVAGLSRLLARYELLPEDAVTGHDLEALAVLASAVVGASLLAVAIASLGLLVAVVLRRSSRPDAIEVLAVDPLANCLQFPVVFLIAAPVVSISWSSGYSSWTGSTLVFAAVGSLAVAALVARVARTDLERGWTRSRTTVRAVGVACTGAAVVTLGAVVLPVFPEAAFYAPGIDTHWNRFWAFGLVAMAQVAALFVLGEGLRRAARLD